MDKSKTPQDRHVKVALFDIETDGLLDEMTTIHCAVARYGEETLVWRPHQIGEFVEWLGTVPGAIASHNLYGFDLPAIRKLYPSFAGSAVQYDTLVLARLARPDCRDLDFATPGFPKALVGRHSLEAYGYRLGMHKGDYIKTGDFSTFSEEMLEYCKKDVEILARLWKHLWNNNLLAEPSVSIESKFAQQILAITERGVRVNVEGLKNEAAIARSVMNEGISVLKEKTGLENPLSRVQLGKYLLSKGWEPTDWTPTGRPRITDTDAIEKQFPELGGVLSRTFSAQKVLGYISEGPQALLNWVVPTTSRIHAKIIHNGARTGRCSHFHPNLAQVPTSRTCADLGVNIRQHFLPDEGEKLVGTDAQSLEFRILAHYLISVYPPAKRYFLPIFLEGRDIHEENRQKAGLPSRDLAKTFLYALMYGAGPTKLGTVLGCSPKEAKSQAEAFIQALPGFASLRLLINRVTETKSWIRGLDGRRLWLKSKHSALNTLIQGGGAIVMKAFTNRIHHKILLHVHDEVQISTHSPDAVRAYLHQAAEQTTQALSLQVPFEVQSQIGDNWDETH